jgi:hypothetical protein
VNAIWKIELQDGSKVKPFPDITEAGMRNFKNLFKEPDEANIGKVMKIVSLFPKHIDDQMNKDLDEEVTKEELKAVLNSFKKVKSPGPDGWTVKIFWGFYDFIEEKLLRIVEESRVSSKILDTLNSTFTALIPKKNEQGYFKDYKLLNFSNPTPSNLLP